MEQGGSTWVGVSFLAKTAAAMLFGKGFFITFIFSRIDLIGGSTEVSSEVENVRPGNFYPKLFVTFASLLPDSLYLSI